MALRIVTISDGFESSTVPSIGLPTVTGITTLNKTLTGPEILAASVTLSTTPTKPTETTLYWSGISQYYGTDFTVSGSTVTFLSRLLTLLSINDEITIQYS